MKDGVKMDDDDRVLNFIAVIRSMIQHENTLLNQRMVWMWTLQGLLFSAIGFLWKFNKLPVLIISLVGFLSCFSIGYSLNRANKAIKDLLSIASNYKKSKGKKMI